MKHRIYVRPTAAQIAATGEATTTVGQYLVDRLAEIGLKHLFSIPGDYTVEWVDRYVVPSKKISPAMLSTAKSSSSVPITMPSGSATTL